ncbi:MAG: histidine phosphatase family protein [Armatimonadetes bacterium]|nr:histidine phosphatase family protein [Armatimonadota bacterium]
MITIYYERHARSVDNERRVASGHRDVELSEAGRAQARELGERHAAVQLDAVFCSDLRRSYETAEIAFAGRELLLIRDRRLREWDYGACTGRPWEEVDAAAPRHLTEPFPAGESVVQAAERLASFLRELSDRYDGKTVVIVGHWITHVGLEYWINGGILGEALAAASSWPHRQIYILNDAARTRLKALS